MAAVLSPAEITWSAPLEAAAELECWPYSDRVHSEPNPIDGVSRGDFTGPWDRVVEATVPVQLSTQMVLGCS